MKTNIYYFTGTGNSLAIAKQLGDKLENSQLISIPKIIHKNEIIASEVVGIVCPTYMHNIPLIVADFIKKLKNPQYLFWVLLNAGEPGNILKSVQKLCSSQNITIDATFNVIMPSNYAPYGSTPEEKQQILFKDAEQKLDLITNTVGSKEKLFEKSNTSFFKRNVFPGLLYKLGYRFISQMDKSFIADTKCNGCEICSKVCPVDNITIIDHKPQWHNQCQQCYACLQWCPQEAIQFGKRTIGVTRYHHPDITLNEIIQSAEKS